MALAAAARAAVGGDHGGEQGGVPRRRQLRPAPPRLHHGVDRGRFRHHDGVGARRQHLGGERRAAARHVEDQPARFEALRRRRAGEKIRERETVAEGAVERRAQRAAHRILEERLAQRPRAEIKPVDENLAAEIDHLHRQPVGARPGGAARRRGGKGGDAERVGRGRCGKPLGRNRDAARGRLAHGERGEVAHVRARVQAARQRVVRHRQRAQPAESLTRDVGHAKNRYAGARRAR